jgi:hypothetical protein
VTKIQYYTATSLDAYVADEQNSLAWLFEVDRASTGDRSAASSGNSSMWTPVLPSGAIFLSPAPDDD